MLEKISKEVLFDISNKEGFIRGWKYRLSFLTCEELLKLKEIIELDINERINKK